jgi:hypothetical protein
MRPFSFEELTLVVPELWEKPWAELIEDAEGLERDLISAQARYAHLLKGIQPSPVTPEKLAWLALWSRLFGCISGCMGTVKWEARFPAGVLARVAFEASLHLQAVMIPVLDAAETRKLSEADWTTVRERLRAYLTWSLRGDEALYRHVSSDRILDEAFDRRGERDFINFLGESREAWEHLTGQHLEVVSDQEALYDRSKAVARFRKERERLARWVSDSRLKPWYRQLRELEQQTGGNVSLFLFLGVGNSVPAFLRSRGTGVGYFEYLQGSAAIHGSSFEATMLTTDEVIAPDFGNLTGEYERVVDRVLSNVRLQAILLELLSAHLNGTP